MGCGVGSGDDNATGMVSVLMAVAGEATASVAPFKATISSSICSADKSVSSESGWSLLKSITADIRFVITSISISVCKYVFILSVAEWFSIIYSTSFSTLGLEIRAIHDEEARSISIERITYDKKLCNVIFLE